MNRLALTLGVIGAAALTACHGDQTTEQSTPPTTLVETPPSPDTAPAPAAPAAPSADAAPAGPAWKDMKHEEREHYMKTVVLPTMKPHFARWEPDGHSSIKCVTCHGEGAKDKTFKMPNPKLPELPSDEAGWKKLHADEPEAMTFMREIVVPTMAKMLGEEPYDAVTKKGFGCFNCHTAKK